MAEKRALTKATRGAKRAGAKPASGGAKAAAKESEAKDVPAAARSPQARKRGNQFPGDIGIVIVDDDIEIDQDKVNEERRAYLEEARSQEAFD